MAQFDIVFEGGGAKGIAFAGALDVFFRQAHTVRRVVGASAGAISAVLVAAGYTPQELLEAVTEKLPNGKARFSTFMDRPSHDDFTEDVKQKSATLQAFNDVRVPLIGALGERALNALLRLPLYAQIFSFIECGGPFVGREFCTWLQEKLQKKGFQATDTLQTFARKTAIDLSVVASDTTEEEMLILNSRTAPLCPVIMAVRMSMSIPFIWQEVIWRQEWGPYLGRQKTGHAIVDGGVLSNFPIRLIADSAPDIREIMGNMDPNAAKNLGLLIDETLEVTNAPQRRRDEKFFSQLRTVQRAMRLVDTMTGARDLEEMAKHKDEICRLPAKGYGTTEFDMTETRIQALIEAGRQAMRRHLGLG
ncbi:MAG TPA: patatin-like phospholipase family protein [Methylomirabilota bacterium]|nr:patatin-like phospholipase family protein [Methylomirabilota bacterium]